MIDVTMTLAVYEKADGTVQAYLIHEDEEVGEGQGKTVHTAIEEAVDDCFIKRRLEPRFR